MNRDELPEREEGRDRESRKGCLDVKTEYDGSMAPSPTIQVSTDRGRMPCRSTAPPRAHARFLDDDPLLRKKLFDLMIEAAEMQHPVTEEQCRKYVDRVFGDEEQRAAYVERLRAKRARLSEQQEEVV